MNAILNRWTPAELMILQEGTNAKTYKLIKYTFFDLILKDVLRLVQVEKAMNKRDRPRIYKYVCVGKRFFSYNPHIIEKLFLDPFNRNMELQVLFGNLVKMVVKTYRNDASLQTDVILNGTLGSCFDMTTSGFWWLKRYHPSLNTKGQKHKEELVHAQEETGRQIQNRIQNKEPELLTQIKDLSGALFLLPGIDFEALEELLNKHFNLDRQTRDAFYVLRTLEEQNKEYDSSGCGSGCSSDNTDGGDGIDSGCSSDSSCGGDGGSGCSSCGGGCGGGD